MQYSRLEATRQYVNSQHTLPPDNSTLPRTLIHYGSMHMPFVSGYLQVREGNSIDNSLPGSQPGIDNTLPGSGFYPDNTLPLPPPGVWPPLTPGNPIRPVRPDQGLPGSQPHPDQGLPGHQPHPDNSLPLQPGVIWPPIQGARDKYLVLVVIPGVGWRYVVIDASLQPDNALPGHQPHPDHGLPGAQPGPDQGLPGQEPAPQPHGRNK